MSRSRSLSRALLVLAVLSGGAALAQPANDLCANAEVINVVNPGTVYTSSPALVSTATAGVEAPGFACFTSSVKNSVWYVFTAPNNGIYKIDTCGVSNYDTIIQAYSGSSCGALTTLGSTGCNDQGGCTPTNASSLTLTLSQGATYYVQVASYSSVTLTGTSSTALNVSFVQAPANDFCANAAQVTPSATPGTTVSTSPVPVAAATAASESVMSCATTKNDIWYTFVPAVSGPHRIDNCANSNFDSVLALYSGSCTALVPVVGACNDSGPTGCSSTGASSFTVNLTAGVPYYAQVAAQSSATLSTTTTSGLNITPLVATVGDSCGPTSPVLPLNTSVTTLTASVDAGFVAAALDDARVDAGTCYTGVGQTYSTAAGRDVAFQFRATEAGRYSFRINTPSPSLNAVLYLTDSCQPVSNGFAQYAPPACMAASNRTTSASEEVSCVQLAANQTVYVWVDESTQSTSGSAVSLEATPCVQETASNDTPATASPLSCAVTGSIEVAGDVDFYALGAPAAGTRVFAMAEAAAASANNFDLRVTTETTTIEYDDSNLQTPWGASAPVVAGSLLNGLPAYLRVNYNTSTTAAEPYVLYSALQFAAPTPEAEPNNTIATATASATNYFAGSITDGGNDVDFYSFTANAGDVIFAALDAVPEKTDAGVGSFNLDMNLVDGTGAVLATADDSSTTVTLTAGATLTSTTPTYPAEGLVYRARTSGTYGVRVYKTSGLNPNAYFLSVSVGCTDALPTLTTVSPSTGGPSGNATVVLSGTNFSPRSVVKFGNTYATVVSVTPTSITVKTPAAASSGDVAVSVTNGPGLVATLNPGYTYDDPPGIPPTISNVTPTIGPVTGGTVLTITGTVFRADAGVFFDVGGVQVPATSVTVNTAARITATTPPHAQGAANVRVINYDNLDATAVNAFTYQGPPTVSSIVPNAGLTTGGQSITLTGTNFRAGTTVRIGGTLATSVVVASDGLSLTCNTPTSTVNGAVDVVVRTTDGQNVTLPGAFTYAFPAPTITNIAPASGTTLGGTTVTISGSDYLTGVAVTFGGTPATSVNRVSATSLTAVTPAGADGLVDVRVTNTDTQSVTRVGGFRYIAPPALTSITPTHGPVQGGTVVSLTGQDFLPGASVTIGGVPAFAVNVTSRTAATAVSNSGMAGPADVTLTNPDGQRATLTAAFTYDPAPLVESLAPMTGSTAGGTTVTVRGSGFLAGATVLFGADAATNVTVTSPTELTAVTPARSVGVVSVTVRNADGQASELPRAFRFVAPPMVSSASPNTGDVKGGTEVHITGVGFTAGSTVTFGGTPAALVSFVSTTELDAVTAAHAPGLVDVVVTSDGASATLAGAFTFTRGAPEITAVAPISGPTTGGTLLTLTGSGFVPGATVKLDGVAATDVIIVSDVLARAVVPAHAAGAVDVVLTNDDGQAATLTRGFTYVTPPTGSSGTVEDGGTGSLGTDPDTNTGPTGGVSCGCSSFDASTFSLAGMGLLLVLSRRRRRS